MVRSGVWPKGNATPKSGRGILKSKLNQMTKPKYHWNYRTVRHKDGDGYYYEIVEMHYDEHGKPRGSGSAKVGGNSPDEIMGVLEMMHISTAKPILDAITFEEVK